MINFRFGSSQQIQTVNFCSTHLHSALDKNQSDTSLNYVALGFAVAEVPIGKWCVRVWRYASLNDVSLLIHDSYSIGIGIDSHHTQICS